jgi:hypothetical protein
VTHPDDAPVYQPVVSYVPVQPAAVPATGAAPFPAEPAPARDKRTRTSLLVVAFFVLVVAVAGTLVFTLQASRQPLTIEYGLLDTDGGSDCSGGDGGYSDIAPGMPVTVADEKGTILASTTIPETGEDLGFGCIWTLRVAVPDDAAQYSIEGGRRGAVTYSHQELQAQHWQVSLGIGD